MRHLCVFFPWLATLSLSAQTQPSGYDAQQNMNAVGAGGVTAVRAFDNRYEGVHGSPYLFPYWCNADIELAGNQVHADVPVKYDVYLNQLVMRRPQGDSVVILPGLVAGFVMKDVISGKNHVFRCFTNAKTDDATLKYEYFEVLHNGAVVLLTRYDRKLVKASYQGAYNAGRPFDELMPEKSHYLKKADGTFVKLKLGKKALLEHLEKPDEAEKIIKSQKLDLKKEADAVKLLEACEKLD
jgi:hypothetical protein